jgi:hypothetical protein
MYHFFANKKTMQQEEKIHFYHICIKGYNGMNLYLDNDDFRMAVNYTAISQYKTGIEILAYCHMDNHSHFVISADKYEDAEKFSFSYKHVYSRYLVKKYGLFKTFKREDTLTKEIGDIQYLRQCIAYVLRNPFAARIIQSVTGYSWSSISCYFQKCPLPSQGRTYKISSLSVRQAKAILHSKCSLKACNYIIDSDGMIIPDTFVNARLVESIFNGSSAMFLKYLGWQDDNKFDFELIFQQTLHYDDKEVKAIAERLSQGKYGKGINEITPDQSRRLAALILSKHRISAARIARILSLRKSEVEKFVETSHK